MCLHRCEHALAVERAIDAEPRLQTDVCDTSREHDPVDAGVRVELVATPDVRQQCECGLWLALDYVPERVHVQLCGCLAGVTHPGGPDTERAAVVVQLFDLGVGAGGAGFLACELLQKAGGALAGIECGLVTVVSPCDGGEPVECVEHRPASPSASNPSTAAW